MLVYEILNELNENKTYIAIGAVGKNTNAQTRTF